jgi:hypothetical protein
MHIMVDDHTKANEALKQVASRANINVPDALDSKHQSWVDKLSKLSGTEFDRSYIKDQLKDHQQDVKEFQNEADSRILFTYKKRRGHERRTAATTTQRASGTTAAPVALALSENGLLILHY